MFYDLTCAECNMTFSTAASLLQHFAQHANAVNCLSSERECQNSNGNKRPNMPDLYPISSLKINLKENEEVEENVDSGIEDLSNPLRYCKISMTEGSSSTSSPEDNDDRIDRHKSNPKRYKCMYCDKTFGWSTDLKRHVLIHTGERPFKCPLCDLTFTRKFLLQKHHIKQHDALHNGKKTKMPPLRPLGFMSKRKARKQDKQKIKRKVANVKNVYQSISDSEVVSSNEDNCISLIL